MVPSSAFFGNNDTKALALRAVRAGADLRFTKQPPAGNVSHKASIGWAAITFCQARGYLPSFRASPPLAGTNLDCLMTETRV